MSITRSSSSSSASANSGQQQEKHAVAAKRDSSLPPGFAAEDHGMFVFSTDHYLIESKSSNFAPPPPSLAPLQHALDKKEVALNAEETRDCEDMLFLLWYSHPPLGVFFTKTFQDPTLNPSAQAVIEKNSKHQATKVDVKELMNTVKRLAPRFIEEKGKKADEPYMGIDYFRHYVRKMAPREFYLFSGSAFYVLEQIANKTVADDDPQSASVVTDATVKILMLMLIAQNWLPEYRSYGQKTCVVTEEHRDRIVSIFFEKGIEDRLVSLVFNPDVHNTLVKKDFWPYVLQKIENKLKYVTDKKQKEYLMRLIECAKGKSFFPPTIGSIYEESLVNEHVESAINNMQYATPELTRKDVNLIIDLEEHSHFYVGDLIACAEGLVFKNDSEFFKDALFFLQRVILRMAIKLRTTEEMEQATVALVKFTLLVLIAQEYFKPDSEVISIFFGKLGQRDPLLRLVEYLPTRKQLLTEKPLALLCELQDKLGFLNHYPEWLECLDELMRDVDNKLQARGAAPMFSLRVTDRKTVNIAFHEKYDLRKFSYSRDLPPVGLTFLKGEPKLIFARWRSAGALANSDNEARLIFAFARENFFDAFELVACATALLERGIIFFEAALFCLEKAATKETEDREEMKSVIIALVKITTLAFCLRYHKELFWMVGFFREHDPKFLQLVTHSPTSYKIFSYDHWRFFRLLEDKLCFLDPKREVIEEKWLQVLNRMISSNIFKGYKFIPSSSPESRGESKASADLKSETAEKVFRSNLAARRFLDFGQRITSIIMSMEYGTGYADLPQNELDTQLVCILAQQGYILSNDLMLCSGAFVMFGKSEKDAKTAFYLLRDASRFKRFTGGRVDNNFVIFALIKMAMLTFITVKEKKFPAELKEEIIAAFFSSNDPNDPDDLLKLPKLRTLPEFPGIEEEFKNYWLEGKGPEVVLHEYAHRLYLLKEIGKAPQVKEWFTCLKKVMNFLNRGKEEKLRLFSQRCFHHRLIPKKASAPAASQTSSSSSAAPAPQTSASR